MYLCIHRFFCMHNRVTHMYEKARNTFDYIISGYESLRKTRIELHRRYPYLDYSEICFMAHSVGELYTEGNWACYAFKDYEKFKQKLNLERIEKGIIAFQDINNGRRREGYSKVRLVPYNPQNGRINQCNGRQRRKHTRVVDRDTGKQPLPLFF